MADMPTWFQYGQNFPSTHMFLITDSYNAVPGTVSRTRPHCTWLRRAGTLMWSSCSSVVEPHRLTRTRWRFSFWKRSHIRKCSAWYDPGAHSGSTRPLLGDHGVREAGDQPQEPQSQDRDDGDLNSIKWAFNYRLICLQYRQKCW